MVGGKVLITTSGLGSRLGNLTKYTNKSLVRVGDRAVISHIVDLYPDLPLVITLGHRGDEVRQYLQLAHPDRTIEFVEIDRYHGEGSSLLYSISKCRDQLQCPFIFHACDTLLAKGYVNFDSNWSIGCAGDSSQVYRTITSMSKRIVRINEKGEQNFDYIYVGVSGIKDYELFWHLVEDILSRKTSNDLSDCHVVQRMLGHTEFQVVVTDGWHDVGNIDALKEARDKIPSTIRVLDKEDENIFLFDESFVVKYFHDQRTCADRVTRAKVLAPLVPKLLGSTKNFYKYEYARGQLLADVVNLGKFRDLLQWALSNLWFPKEGGQTFFASAVAFYRDKTLARVQKFLGKYGLKDTEDIINGVRVPRVHRLLQEVDFYQVVGEGRPTGFHGDFTLDNIIYHNGAFQLIDWRQDFNGLVEVGDRNYDLAKLNHNLILNHEVLTKGLYRLDITEDEVICDVMVKKSLLDCQKELRAFCENHRISYGIIEILTALIWLNMAPLHEKPLDEFLHYFGKYNLLRALQR